MFLENNCEKGLCGNRKGVLEKAPGIHPKKEEKREEGKGGILGSIHMREKKRRRNEAGGGLDGAPSLTSRKRWPPKSAKSIAALDKTPATASPVSPPVRVSTNTWKASYATCQRHEQPPHLENLP